IAPVEVAPVSLVTEKLALPPVMASPALDLPKISYPEFTPAEEPVAETASVAQRRRRPLHLGGAVIVLVLGAYAARSAFSPARAGCPPALEPRARGSAPAPRPAASVPAADSVHPIAPAPVDVDLSVPLLPGSEPLVTGPAQRGDSAMKRILKAVAGGKEPTP